MFEMIESKLGTKVRLHEIDIAHRLGLGHRVKFVRRVFKKAVLANRTKLNGTRLVIKEDLTKKRVNLLKLQGQKYGPRKAWSFEGKIYA